MAKRQAASRDEDSYFVSIKNPTDTRRHLLESTKKSLVALQNYHRLLVIRQEKQRHFDTLKQSIKELLYLDSKLDEKLPDYNPEIMNEFKQSSGKTAAKKPKKASSQAEHKSDTVKREKTELEKLEESLSSIEEKLKTLN